MRRAGDQSPTRPRLRAQAALVARATLQRPHGRGGHGRVALPTRRRRRHQDFGRRAPPRCHLPHPALARYEELLRQSQDKRDAGGEICQVVFFAGNFQDYEEDKKKRLGEDAAQPKRIRYKPLVRQ